MPEAVPGSFMTGKRGLIMGIANDRSLAWGVAEAVGELRQALGVSLHLGEQRVARHAECAGGGRLVAARRLQRAADLFGFRAGTSFEDGLRATIDWYKASVAETAVSIP